MPSPIFVVDSSPAVRRMVEQISAQEGFDVVGFQDGPAALEAARQRTPSLIIADYHLDNMTFSGFCKEVNKLDHLTETFLVSLINPADHPDENHLRTLGVKAFLKKPFQSEDLLEVLKSIQKTPAASSNGNGLKRRVWPPTATSTDADSDEPSDHVVVNEGQDNVQSQYGPAAVIPPGSSAGPEDAMKGLFDQLLHSMTKQTEKKVIDLLPRVIEDTLAKHGGPIIHKEVQAQLSEILSEEHLSQLVPPILSRELPSLLGKEILSYEPLIRQTASDLVGSLIKASIDQWVREQAEIVVRQHLPEVIREHLGSVDQMIKDEIRAAALKQAPLFADDIVRTTAEQSVEEAVQRIVPDIAEQQIKAELKRLIETEDTSHPTKV